LTHLHIQQHGGHIKVRMSKPKGISGDSSNCYSTIHRHFSLYRFREAFDESENEEWDGATESESTHQGSWILLLCMYSLFITGTCVIKICNYI